MISRTTKSGKKSFLFLGCESSFETQNSFGARGSALCVTGSCLVRAAAEVTPHVQFWNCSGLSPRAALGSPCHDAGGQRQVGGGGGGRGSRAPQGDGALCVNVLLLVSPLQPGRQDQTSCHGKLGERVVPRTQHWDKPIDLISPALHFSFAQTAASGLVNSGHVQSRAHWTLCVEGIKPVNAAKELCTGTSFAPDVSITCCTKTRIYQVPQTPGLNSPPTDGCTSPVGRELFLLC